MEVKIMAIKEGYEQLSRYVAKYSNNYATNVDANGIATISVAREQEEYYWLDYSHLRAVLNNAFNNESVKGILLSIDSPGGEVAGAFELCDYIREMRNIKPIYTMVEGMACSAAYAIASSTSYIAVSDSSIIGSIGVMARTVNDNEYYKQKGILFNIFHSKRADKKILDPSTEEGKKKLLEELDFFEDKFYETVKAGRNLTDKECDFEGGTTFVPERALEKKLVDEISTYSEVYQKLQAVCDAGGKGENMTDVKNLSAEQRQALFAQLTACDPNLSNAEQVVLKERARIAALDAVSDAITHDVVSKAKENGENVEEIMSDILNLYKAEVQRLNNELDKIKPLANNQTPPATVPSPVQQTPEEQEVAKAQAFVDKYINKRQEI